MCVFCFSTLIKSSNDAIIGPIENNVVYKMHKGLIYLFLLSLSVILLCLLLCHYFLLDFDVISYISYISCVQ